MIRLRSLLGKLATAGLFAGVLAWVGGTPSFAQGGSVYRQVVSPDVPTGTGQPAPNSIIRICPSTASGTPCSPTSNVFADPTLIVPLTNPFATDANGNYSVFLATGTYIVQETPVPGVTYSFLVFVNGTGTVSSVGLSLPVSLFTVSGSPVFTVGTLTGTLVAQSANTVFANCTGGSAVPVFCALTANMIPGTLNSTTINGLIVNGTLATASSGNTTIGGTLGVTGAGTFSNTLGVTGPATLSNTLGVTGTSTLAAVNSGAINSSSTIGASGSITTANQLASTVITGTAPLSVASTTRVANLNASQLEDKTWEVPGAIGSTTPSTAVFSTLRANTNFVLNGSAAMTTVVGSPDTSLLAASTVVANAPLLCTDANGGATTSCSSGSTGPVFAPHKVTSSGDFNMATSHTVYTLLTESVTIPFGAGTYRVIVSYSQWYVTGGNVCSAEVVDTTNNRGWAPSQHNDNGLGWSALVGSEVSTQTYNPGDTATFTLKSVCDGNGITASQFSAQAGTLSPNLPSYLSVTPVLSD